MQIMYNYTTYCIGNKLHIINLVIHLQSHLLLYIVYCILYCILYCITCTRPYTKGRLDCYRIDIPRELSEIHTQPWLSEGSLTCDPCHHRGPIF